MEEKCGPVLQQQADAVALPVAGLRISRAQALDFGYRLAPANGAGGDTVGRGGHRFGEQKLGLRRTRCSRRENLMDGGKNGGVLHRVPR